MNIVVTCPRYFSELNNLNNLLSKHDIKIDYIEPNGQGFSLNEMKLNLKDASIAVVGDDQIDDTDGDGVNDALDDFKFDPSEWSAWVIR